MNGRNWMIDAAFQTYPVEELPPGYFERLKRRVLLSPRFRLDFLDFALPAFGAIFTLVCLYLLPWMFAQVDPSAGSNFPEIWNNLIASSSGFPFWTEVTIAFVLFSGVMIFAIGLILWLEQPAVRFRSKFSR